MYKPPPPLYKPIKNRLRKYISPGLIVGGLWYVGIHNKMTTIYNILLVCGGVNYSGEYVCDVTLSMHPHRAELSW